MDDYIKVDPILTDWRSQFSTQAKKKIKAATSLRNLEMGDVPPWKSSKMWIVKQIKVSSSSTSISLQQISEWSTKQFHWVEDRNLQLIDVGTYKTRAALENSNTWPRSRSSVDSTFKVAREPISDDFFRGNQTTENVSHKICSTCTRQHALN